MINDFITLTCPSCGGQLQIGANTSLLTCQFCGEEHLVRREGDAVTLEAFARCPKCGRNDRVEKVSSILRSHTQEVVSTEQRDESYFDEQGQRLTHKIEVPITKTQVTGLASVLIPPCKPTLLPKPDSLPKPELIEKPTLREPFTFRRILKIGLFVFGSIMILTWLFVSAILISIIISEPDLMNFLCGGAVILALLVMTVAAFVIGIKLKPFDAEKSKQWEERKNLLLAQWQRDNEQMIHHWKDQNEKALNHWQKQNSELKERWQFAMDNWNNLYFCHRDDCVFVPGKGTHAPIEELETYLYRRDE
jgi:predicted RNA-binding Zn-ribbon protein involved in translation (DUF1610 family)